MRTKKPVTPQMALRMFEAAHVLKLLKQLDSGQLFSERRRRFADRLVEIGEGHPTPDKQIYPVLDEKLSFNEIVRQVREGKWLGEYIISNIILAAACNMFNGASGESFFNYAFRGGDRDIALRDFYSGRFNPFE